MILALDTCLAACSAALWDGARGWARTEVLGTGHAERIAPMVAELLEEAGAAASDLVRVCCTVGPGSFMGARVGISLAKGLALPRGVPTVPITTTEAIALGADRPVTVLIDARRGGAYAETFGEAPVPLSLIPYEAARARPRPVLGVGLGAVLAEEAGGRADDYPDPLAMARHAETAPPGRLRPLYLRAPDAKPGRAPL